MSIIGNYSVEINVDDAAHSDKIEQPPKKWRNWYLAKVKLAFTDRPNVVKAGEVFHGSGVWPSKEVAEEKARLRDGRQPPEMICQYLGAEPEK